MKSTTTASVTLTMLGCAILSGCVPTSTETATTTAEVSELDTQGQPKGSEGDSEHKDFYTVSSYDESADPADDLARTISRAQAEQKRVILQVGGDWCVWCGRISDYMTSNATVRDYLNDHFLVMKVTYPGEYAEEFLSAYPEREAYPHFFVLDEEGGLLHSQPTGVLEEGKGYDQEAFMAFLAKWSS